MTPRPGRIDHEIVSPLFLPAAETRMDPAYAALVARVTHELERGLAA